MTETMETRHLQELRWYSYIKQVVDYVVIRPDYDGVYETLVDIAASKARTVIEANDKKTPVLLRICFLIWLGFLTEDWEEAEVLKWLACQEYLLYRCRGEPPEGIIDKWLKILCTKIESQTPSEVHTDLLDRLKHLEELFGIKFEKHLGLFGIEFEGHSLQKLITQPCDVLRKPDWLQFLIDGSEGSNKSRINQRATDDQTSFQQINQISHIELQTLDFLQKLEQDSATLEGVLKTYGNRIKQRQDDIAAYREQIMEYALDANPEFHKNKNLRAMMEIFRLAQTGEQDDLDVWHRLDMERESILLTIGRLQKLLRTKKKTNHNKNKNKNKNRALKKKLQQDEQAEGTDEQTEGTDGDADTHKEAKESDEIPKLQGFFDGTMQEKDYVRILRYITGGLAPEMEKARAEKPRG